jgi:hypothetical protein
MSQLLVRDEAGSVADWIRAALGEAGFAISSDQCDSLQIGPAGQLGERHNIVFERRAPSAGPPGGSELLQVWVVEAGTDECTVTVMPRGDLARNLLDGLAEKYGNGGSSGSRSGAGGTGAPGLETGEL